MAGHPALRRMISTWLFQRSSILEAGNPGMPYRSVQLFIERVRRRMKALPPDLVFVVCICLLTILISLPLFRNQIIQLGDGTCAFTKAIAMFQSWRDGDWVGRLTPDIIRGYGYPMFNFYSPLFFYGAAIIMFAGIPVFLAFNMILVLLLLISGLGMYFLAKDIWGRDGGFLAAIAYLLMPFHIADLYVRGAVAEFAAFAFMPFILWSIRRVMAQGDAGWICAGVLATGGLILSHNITTMLFLPVSFLYVLFIFFTDARRDFRRLAGGMLILAGGVALSAYFWLPALVEKGAVQIERLLTSQYQYGNNFYPFVNLLISPWGPKDGAGTPHMIGLVQLLLALGVVLSWKRLQSSVKGSGGQVLFFALFVGGFVFLMLKASMPVWQALPLLAYTQFPVRLLVPVSVAIAVLAGGIVPAVDERWQKPVLWWAVAAVIAANISFCHPFGYQKISYSSAREYLTGALPMDNMEFLPRGVRQISLAPPDERLQVIAGEAQVSRGAQTALERRYHVRVGSAAVFFYHVYYFPGWQVEIDRQNVPVRNDNPYGVVMFVVPLGEHEVRIHFGTTPVRAAAQTISLVALVLLCAGSVGLLWRRQCQS